MVQIPDHPDIREAEAYGMPPYDDGPEPTCPICGAECETIYVDKHGDEVGCDKCISTVSASDWQQINEED